jgi:3-methyl-2-oxobutanoate hydroxymethyltransferase
MKSRDGKVVPLNIHDIQLMKIRGEKIVVHSPMDFNTAQMVDEAGADIVIIGDSLPTMILGADPNTLGSTMQGVLFFTERITRGITRAVIVSGVPYGAYQESNDKAIQNAVQLVKAGAHSVKIQGANDTVLERIKRIIEIGIPVMGHVGLTPHYIRQIGRFRAVGKTAKEARQVYDDVKKLEDVGVWAIEMECVAERVAEEITKRTPVPIIGIGSGNVTDGQSLAFHDILGLLKRQKPKHSKCYVNLWPICVDALKEFTQEVKQTKFPTAEHSFRIQEDEYEEFYNSLE